MPNTPRVQDNERVERSDFEFATDDVPQAYHRALGGNFLTNPAGMKLWIVSGFDMTNPSAKQLRVTRGVAILNAREDGQTVSGMLAFEGDTQKTVDLNAYAVGTYGIWIRFELSDGEFQNRIFWNPTGLNEFTQSMATRRVASWGVRVEPVLSNPGADWFKIGEVAVAAGPPLTITQQRKFYFEGDEAASYAATISDSASYRTWGGGPNDRNADRAAYGVRDIQTMFAALREQLRAMQGSNPATPWYGSVVEGLNRKVSRFGDNTLAGHYLPDTTNAYDLGSSAKRWNKLWATDVDVAGNLIVWRVASNLHPSVHDTYDLGTSPLRWRTLYLSQDLHVGDTIFAGSSNFVIGPTMVSIDGANYKFDGDVIPSAGGFDLGSAALRWHAFLDTVNVSTDARPDTDFGADLGITAPPQRWNNIYGSQVSAFYLYGLATTNAPLSAGAVVARTQRNAIVARGTVNIFGSGPPTRNLGAKHWNVVDITVFADPGEFRINFDHPVDDDSTIIVTPYRPGVSAVDMQINAYIEAGGASALVFVRDQSGALVNRGFHFVVVGSAAVDLTY